MTLPIITVPTYTLEIPSTKKKVKYRPFVVKEQKIILIALQEAKDTKSQNVMLDAMKQIITNCTFGLLNPDELTTYDLEYIFLQLKIKSSGSTMELSFKCSNEITSETISEDKKTIITKSICDQVNAVTVNLDEAKLSYTENRNNKIMLTDSIGIILKDPSLASLSEDGKTKKKTETDDIIPLIDTIFDGETVYSDYSPEELTIFIDTIFDGETVYSDYSPEELTIFIDSLPTEQYKKISDYFESIPVITLDIKVKCSKCGYEETVTLEGLQSFLA